ncbi:unnamed protein product [Vitrella brassicaformis CCMP3155]|uniref:Cyanovirin-N domain-containing protein n=2 Tax=Vitrella brassicaformis TaxID=1169539 RepID=A0A0G4FAR4_VITBC|nr:unnamed protein product [Vitrella brassicaformis CCMP3155]|eukprot:CEM09683.1 unnamed protein product [Vitrella brassicaformis CCMP3155]
MTKPILRLAVAVLLAAAVCNAGRNIYVSNSCYEGIDVALHYRDSSRGWVTECWWSVEPHTGDFLATSGSRIQTDSTSMYHFAETFSDGKLWSGSSLSTMCKGRSLSMTPTNSRIGPDGNVYVNFSCPNRRLRAGVADEILPEDIELKHKNANITTSARAHA